MNVLWEIKEKISDLLFSTMRKVNVKDCCHYCGFRYGHGEYNPYESYVMDLHNGIPEKTRKERFTNFLVHYRPASFGEAIGVSLGKPYPMWQYPWWTSINPHYNAHDMQPHLIPDIITHFSGLGIPQQRIEGEFNALETVYFSILNNGYLPREHGYPKLLTLDNNAGKVAHILIDGNHRVSALSALGITEFLARQNKKYIINRNEVSKWPGVLSGYYSPEDALKIFDLYFRGNSSYRVGIAPAKII